MSLLRTLRTLIILATITGASLGLDCYYCSPAPKKGFIYKPDDKCALETLGELIPSTKNIECFWVEEIATFSDNSRFQNGRKIYRGSVPAGSMPAKVGECVTSTPIDNAKLNPHFWDLPDWGPTWTVTKTECVCNTDGCNGEDLGGGVRGRSIPMSWVILIIALLIIHM